MKKFGYVTNRLISFIDPSKGDKFQSSSTRCNQTWGFKKVKVWEKEYSKKEFQKHIPTILLQ